VFLKAEVVNDFQGLGGEALDVVSEVGSDVVGVALELLEGIAAGIIEGDAGDPA
jgi:hypothetical protein